MRNLRRSFFWAVIFALAGCAASGPAFQPAPLPESGKALIYIYRPGAFALGARNAYFYIDDNNVVDLSQEGYTYIYLVPGTYNVKQKWPIDLVGFKDLELPLNVESGKTYYYRFHTGGNVECTPGNICFGWSMRRVSEQDAKAELSQCRYQPSK